MLEGTATLSSTLLDQNSLHHQHLFAAGASQCEAFVPSPAQSLRCAALPVCLLHGNANVFQGVSGQELGTPETFGAGAVSPAAQTLAVHNRNYCWESLSHGAAPPQVPQPRCVTLRALCPAGGSAVTVRIPRCRAGAGSTLCSLCVHQIKALCPPLTRTDPSHPLRSSISITWSLSHPCPRALRSAFHLSEEGRHFLSLTGLLPGPGWSSLGYSRAGALCKTPGGVRGKVISTEKPWWHKRSFCKLLLQLH